MAETNQPSYRILSSPSKVLGYHETVVDIRGKSIQLILVTMKRSYLLVIQSAGLGKLSENQRKGSDKISKQEMLLKFMNPKTSLNGLSIAIGEHSSCLIDSDNSLHSVSLASRLSKKLNLNRPVYVSNQIGHLQDEFDSTDFTVRLYMRIFQFVNANYKTNAPDEPIEDVADKINST